MFLIGCKSSGAEQRRHKRPTRKTAPACPPALVVQLVDEHVHRVYVVDSDDRPRVQAVITPTDVLRMVAGVY